MFAITRSMPWPSETPPEPPVGQRCVHVRLVERPPAEVGDRGGDGPDGELAQVAPDEADRAEQTQPQRDRAEDERPEPARLEAEDALRERGGRGRDDDQLEGRPAEVLRDVEHRRRVRASPAERRPQQHHAGHTSVGADHPGEAEQRAARDRAHHDRHDRLLEREHRHEPGADDDHEQAHREVAPEERQVDEPEHAQALGHGRDPPGRRALVHRRARSASRVPRTQPPRRGRRTPSRRRSAAPAGSACCCAAAHPASRRRAPRRRR